MYAASMTFRSFSLGSGVLSLFLVLVASCGSDDANGGTGPGATGGSGGSGGSGTSQGPATNCVSRCEALSKRCGFGASANCKSACSQTTETLLSCFEKTDCSDQQLFACQQASSGGGTGGSSSGKGGSGTAIGALGDSCVCAQASEGWCQASGTESECGTLTCIGSPGTKPFCTQNCEDDKCPTGFACTVFAYEGAVMGTYCAKE